MLKGSVSWEWSVPETTTIVAGPTAPGYPASADFIFLGAPKSFGEVAEIGEAYFGGTTAGG